HSRPEAQKDEEPAQWTQNASGLLSEEAPEPQEPLEAWPPEAAEPLDVEFLYDRLAEAGLEYGPAFQGLTAAWREGETVFAEVSLSEEQAAEAERYGLHPALLDAASHAGIYMAPGGTADGTVAEPLLPFAWRDLHIASRGAGSLRLRISPSTDNGLAWAAFDPSGVPVASVGTVAGRAVDADELSDAVNRQSLHRLEWSQVKAGAGDGSLQTPPAILGEVEIAGFEGAERYPDPAALLDASGGAARVPGIVLADFRSLDFGEGSCPEAARAAARAALELAQAWIEARGFEGGRLVFLTEGAVAVAEGESPDLAMAPIWGLVRSAVAEHPGRFALVDVDRAEASLRALPSALTLEGETQLAIRDGLLRAPRLVRVEDDDAVVEPIDPERTVLISGGTRGLGALIARRLASGHGVRHLLLAGRSGEEAEGAKELATELAELGAEATIVACDFADRARLQALIDSIPPDRPLGAVFHAARVVDDGVLGSLDRDRLASAMRPKVDGAWNLHELTEGMELSRFVVFSSAASMLGSPGQANYAAANAFLDALAANRRSAGLPAASLAWGGWLQGESGDARGSAHLESIGLATMPSEQIAGLFDAAGRRSEALLVPAKLQRATLRKLAAAGALSPVFSALVRSSERARSATLLERLDGVPEAEREAVVVDLVREHAAAVLGHDSPEEVDPQREFVELGFDSLAAVELRNRLASETGLQMPVFALASNPTVTGVAQYLLVEATNAAAGKPSADSSVTGLGGSGGGTFMPLLADAVACGTQAEFAEMLSAASKFRATDALPQDGDGPRIVRLAEGSESPGLVLIPSAIAMSGPHEYARFAAPFRGRHAVSALRLPGFGPGEPLPADIGVAARALAEAIVSGGLGSDFALVGYSTGGWLAHAVAAELERAGVAPATLVLLDSYWPEGDVLDQLMPNVLTWTSEAVRAGFPVDDDRLLAMAGYMRILGEWEPPEIPTPTIVVRAREQIWDIVFGAEDARVEPWRYPHSTVEVEGNHFNMMQELAGDTAEAVRKALGARQTTIES
ncbi:MAG TPA: type I polyketide synthase, partial [Solirubrobacterales bacterium]